MKKEKTSVEIVDFSIRSVTIPITGISPLITHCWSEKAKRQIEDKQQQRAKSKKHDVRNPQEEYEGSKYKSPLGFEGMPAAAFKSSIVRASKSLGMVMKDIQMAFFIKPECEETQLIRIFGDSRMRTDMVRVGNGVADIRYRAEYPEWYAELNVDFNDSILSIHQMFQLTKLAGFFTGVGELRPEKTRYQFGRFRLTNEK